MRKHDANPQHERQSKANELDAVYKYLQNNVATATMTATALNIYRPSLCRRKRSLEKAGLLVEVKNAYCKVTKCKAAYLTTNPEWFPQQTQLKFNF
jgi:hypothetical protein